MGFQVQKYQHGIVYPNIVNNEKAFVAVKVGLDHVIILIVVLHEGVGLSLRNILLETGFNIYDKPKKL